MKKLWLCLGLAACLLGPAAPAARAWGIFGHRVITQVAVYELPASLQSFYFRHLSELVRQSSLPPADDQENRRHFIKLDHYSETNPFAKVPRDYDEAVTKFSADTLRKYGTLPWAIMEVKDRLVKAWQEGDSTTIVRASAELSSYAADAFSPLRTTTNYDGQLTNQPGMLALWENQLPERYLTTYKLDGETAKPLKDPLAETWAALQYSYGFLTATFDLETKVSHGFTPQTKFAYAHKFGRTQRRYSDAFADAYNKEVGGMVDYRLKTAAPFVAALWLTAWQEAGRPDVSKLMSRPTAEEKARLAIDLKGFRANTLAPERLLLAQQPEQKVRAADDIRAADGEMVAPPPPEPTAPADAPSPAPIEKVKVKVKPAAAPPAKTKAKPAPTGWE
ncbi:hypothetical protein HHL22_06210 [Hymenobacter sp. RP-2-7]|uniref:S1/P1 Nuclease n=1 Tax=Hymenobacter polaris TaxID=2682546 RepID=A0A7Y0ACF6_9BACT|nr:hypothetical protein [Hymenobacter polaris]NML64794.1 hypothetical protein [Hymenobacter polaris]